MRKYLFLGNAIFKETKSRNRTIGGKNTEGQPKSGNQSHFRNRRHVTSYRIKFDKKLPKSLNTVQTVNRCKNTIYLWCLSPYWDSFNNKYVLQILIELLLHTRHCWKALGIWQWSKQSPTPYELSIIKKNNLTNLNFWHEGGENNIAGANAYMVQKL